MKYSFLFLLPLCAQSVVPLRLTLDQAQQMAMKNNPSVEAARLSVLAVGESAKQIHAVRLPLVNGSVTGAVAAPDTRLAAGALNNPVIYSRAATGVSVSQLITDFGRTSLLEQTAASRTQAESASVNATRLATGVAVRQAYFAGLRAQALVQVTQQTVIARQLVVDQVKALAESKLRSGLDVSFAEVALSEGKLLVATARNQRQSADADLARAIGFTEVQAFELVEEPMPDELKASLAELLRSAIANRPEIAVRRRETEAARSYAAAESKLNRPTISAIGAVGVTPLRVEKLIHPYYSAAGINVSVPLFNGGLFASRRVEAETRALQSEQRVKEMELRVANEVQQVYLQMENARERLTLTKLLLEHSSQALELSQARYDLGLGSIVELSQSQLAKTTAEIQITSARFEYQLQRSLLESLTELRP